MDQFVTLALIWIGLISTAYWIIFSIVKLMPNRSRSRIETTMEQEIERLEGREI